MLILVFFTGFAVVNGFSMGKKEINEIKESTVNLKKTQDAILSRLDELDRKPGSGDGQSGDQLTKNPIPKDQPQHNGRFVPITWETAMEFKDELNRLDFYLSRNLTLIPKDQNNNGVVREGKLMDNEKNPSDEKFVISKSTPVKMVKFSPNPRDRASIKTLFSGQFILLRFVRNTKDCFELDSVTKNAKNYTYDKEGDVPLLCIYDERNNVNRTNVLIQTKRHDVSSFYIRSRPRIPEDIMLKSGQQTYLTEDAVVKYLSEISRGIPYRDIETVIRLYINEAETEKINHDIAIAQMCHATQSLTNKTLWNNRNYAGLSIEGARWNGKNWDGKFPESLTGVRAHIQHLKGYAVTGTLQRDTVDPRFHLLAKHRGNGDTLHKLCAVWVAKENSGKYERNLREMLEDLYTYQERYNLFASRGQF
jgi:hypothetical protein